MPEPLLSVVLAVLTLAACWGAGRAAWRGKPPTETLAFATGAPLVSLAGFALVLAGAASGPAFLLLTLAGAAPLWFFRPPRPVFPSLPWWTLLPLAGFGLYYLVLALAPETQADGTTYHLGLPRAWLRTGGFPAQTGFYDILPLGLETLFAAAGAGSGAKLLHLAFLFLTVPLLVDLAALLALPAAAPAAAAVLYFCAPVVGVSASAAYNDAALVFFFLAGSVLLKRGHWLAAGLCAGFCYAVKINGLAFAAAGLLAAAWLGRWRAAALFSGAALVSIAPWMGRALWVTGNPLAPLANAWFPNAYFHVATEQTLAAYLRNYAGISAWRIPWAATVGGGPLQGLLGPLWLLAPLGLFAWRRGRARWLLIAAAAGAAPWLANLGTRFILPAAPLLGLALASVLPARALPALALLHAVLCVPWIAGLYCDTEAWRPRGFPWRAALRLESEPEYLRRTLGDYRLAEMVNRHVAPGETILDLYALPFAYLNSVPIGTLPSAAFDNYAEALALAARADAVPFRELRATFPKDYYRALRIRLERAPLEGWSLHEVELFRDGEKLKPSAGWLLDAWPNPFETPLAFDGNLVSRWHTWQRAQAGMVFEIRFNRPLPFDAVSAVISARERPGLGLYAQRLDRAWVRLSAAEPAPRAGVSPRHAAMQYLRRNGVRWLFVATWADGHGHTGRQIAGAPADWGVTKVECLDDVCLFRLENP